SDVRRIDRRTDSWRRSQRINEDDRSPNTFMVGCSDYGLVTTYTGTGTVSTISDTTRSACSKFCDRMPCVRFTIIRCDKTMGLRSLASAGSHVARLRTSPKALAAVLSATAPLVRTPNARSSL